MGKMWEWKGLGCDGQNSGRLWFKIRVPWLVGDQVVTGNCFQLGEKLWAHLISIAYFEVLFPVIIPPSYSQFHKKYVCSLFKSQVIEI